MLVSLTVGKVDAGVAVLLTEDKRLVPSLSLSFPNSSLTASKIEFPSILLPPTITSGSIVDITVTQNQNAEQKSRSAFLSLQSQILDTYGLHSPSAPVLRLRNATQTSLVLEWDPIELATSTLRSLALYRNGSKAGNIPRPRDMLCTKISGLAVNTEYSFQLVLRTSGGTYSSNTLTVKTHTMENLTGITVTPGVMPPPLRESLDTAVKRIGAKIVDTVRINTTHFVCTEGRGRDWERAVEMNIPVVRPEWIEGCEREGKLTGVRGYYLDADPKHRQIGSNPALNMGQQNQNQSRQSVSTPQTNLPIRSDPRSPDRESVASGEPGPEVPPTPPPKKNLPPPEEKNLPPPPEEKDEEESEEEQEEQEEKEGAQQDGKDSENGNEKESSGSDSEALPSEKEKEGAASDSRQDDDENDGGGGDEMEDVKL